MRLGDKGSQWRKALSLLKEAKEAGVEVDPATHDAVIAALGKVCAVTHALVRSKGWKSRVLQLFFPGRPLHSALPSALHSALQPQCW